MDCCKCMGYHEDNLSWLVDEIKKALDEWKNLENNFTTLEEYVKNYFNNLDVSKEINKKIDNMIENGTFENIVSKYFDRKIIFVGDSYILGYSNDGVVYRSFANIIKERTDLDITILGTSGAGFANFGTAPNENKNFLRTLQTFVGNKKEITDIYVFGGYNDRTHTPTDIWNNMELFDIYVKSEFPKAKVKVSFIAWSMIPSEYKLLQQTAHVYSRCGTYNMSYIKNSEYILHNTSLFTNDKIHPNEEGHIALSSYLTSALFGGDVNVISMVSELQVPPINNVQLGRIYISLNNSLINVNMPDYVNINLSAYDGNYWGQTWIQLSGRVESSYMLGYEDSSCDISVIWNPKDSTKWYTSPATLKITDGAFYIRIQALKEDNTGLYNGQIAQCIIPSFRMVCPTLLS